MIPPRIGGKPLDQIHTVSAGLGTFAGTRLVTLEDGVERGQRVVEMRSGGGLALDVTVDRAGDIGGLSIAGQTVSWHGAGGLKSASLINAENDKGQGFLNGFGGFLNTCGLDHIRQPEQDDTEYAEQDALAQTSFPLHGKGAFHPAVLRGHGLNDDGDAPVVFCETEFVQTLAFVSALRLRRRIEIPVGGQSLILRDTVRNVGNGPATHMLLYHFNLGFPLVDEGAVLEMGQDTCVRNSGTDDPLASVSAAQAKAKPQISVFAHAADTAEIHLKNPRSGLSLHMRYPRAQLPYCQILRMPGVGTYGLGIEPCTTHAPSRSGARACGEMIILNPGEERHYSLDLSLSTTGQQHG